MPHEKSVFVFHPKLEKAYFAIFFVFLGLIVAMSARWLPHIGWNKQWTSWIVGFVFFNTLHTMLTWIGIFLLPELRGWAKTQISARRWPVVSMIMAAILLGVIYMVWSLPILQPISQYLALVLFIFAAMHNIGQTKGIALLYNARLRSQTRSEDRAISLQCEHRERWLYNALVVTVFLGLVCLKFSSGTYGDIAAQGVLVFVLLGGCTFIAIVLNSRRFPNVSTSNKTLFSFTSIFHILWPLSPAAVAFQRSLHGLEYVFLAHQMASRSKFTWRFGVAAIAVVFGLLAVVGGVANIYWRKVGDPSVAMNFDATPILLFGLWIEYSHYYIDSIMFRMTDESSRRFVGPLLNNTANS